MSRIARWVRATGELLNRPKAGQTHLTKRSLNIDVFVSPYDVPDAVRGFYDEQIKRYVIEFRYIGEEPLRAVPENPCLTVHVGKNSGRIYRIEADVDARSADCVHVQLLAPMITKAIDDLSRVHGGSLREDNYAIAKDLIAQNADAIFEDLPSPGGVCNVR